jgi:sRNA-binding regulator protein Hfq
MELSAASSHDRPPQVQLHAAELIKFRDERRTLVFTLAGGEKLEGAVRWFDDSAIHIVLSDRNELTVFKHSILYYQAA